MNYLISALADAIQDAGCTHLANYPGFHSNELHAALQSQITSSDEKNAFAYAWGCSLAGARAAVSFKNVGLNDAADAFLGAHFAGSLAGLVLILFDDCDIQHSQSRIDVRPYFLIYGGMWLEPREVAEAYKLTKRAFDFSEKFQLPVVVRVTNILYDMGLHPAKWQRSKVQPPAFEPIRRLPDISPHVVHPSEARRMERELAVKNQAIEEFVETLYEDQPEACSPVIICGAKRNVMASNPFRLFTLPVPRKALQHRFSTLPLPELAVYEHGGIPFMQRQIALSLVGDLPQPHMMYPSANFKPKYHNHDFMERLFCILRNRTNSVICGDLGGYTMDPERTLQLCLCYGVSPAVAMGVADVLQEKSQVYCITGDAAFLHSGQQCLYEMAEREVSVSIFVLENGGALGTGGQHISGDFSHVPDGVNFYEFDYTRVSNMEMNGFVDRLPIPGINLIVVHTHENEEEE